MISSKLRQKKRRSVLRTGVSYVEKRGAAWRLLRGQSAGLHRKCFGIAAESRREETVGQGGSIDCFLSRLQALEKTGATWTETKSAGKVPYFF